MLWRPNCLKLHEPLKESCKLLEFWQQPEFKNNILGATENIQEEGMDQMDANELWMEMKNVINIVTSCIKIKENGQPKKPWISLHGN